jgi:NitT/TauT family transport system ATP-binding protein
MKNELPDCQNLAPEAVHLLAARETARPAISLNAVTQTFVSTDGTTVTALDRVDLSIQRHEFVSIIGPSGCGKSTLLRLLAGLLPPTSGEVEIFGLKVAEPRDDIGFVFQRPTLLPWLNVLENVTFPIRHKGGRVTPQVQEQGMALLSSTGLADFARKMPHELSGGMQQRVSIVRALLQDPDILLMDEPFSALDALTRDEMSLELLRVLRTRPKTVVFVTHSIAEAVLLSNRIVVMAARPGRVRNLIDVPLSLPRTLDTMADPLFGKIANDIREQLFSRPRET